MDWVKLQIWVVKTPDYISCEPTQRAAWLNLLAHCAEQENGGRIKGAKEWGDRMWMQLCGVLKAEVSEDCGLFQWEGSDLVVNFYPEEEERLVQKNRENGRRGGRPRKNKAQKPGGSESLNPDETQSEPGGSESLKQSRAEETREEQSRGEGEEPPTPEQILAEAKAKAPSKAPADWIRSLAVEFRCIWEERNWRTNSGDDMRKRWRPRLEKMIQEEWRKAPPRIKEEANGKRVTRQIDTRPEKTLDLS